jgi:hypothetical protein
VPSPSGMISWSASEVAAVVVAAFLVSLHVVAFDAADVVDGTIVN